jgi:hypothetical protein
MNPEAILAENPANLAVLNELVLGIRYKPGKTSEGSDDSSSYEPGRINLETPQDKMELRLAGVEQGLAAQLQALFGERLK